MLTGPNAVDGWAAAAVVLLFLVAASVVLSLHFAERWLRTTGRRLQRAVLSDAALIVIGFLVIVAVAAWLTPYLQSSTPLLPQSAPIRESLGRERSEASSSDASPSTPSVLTYVVRPGDTLRSVAAAELGDESLWPSIYARNRSAIPDPDNLEIGIRLVIPLTPKQ